MAPARRKKMSAAAAAAAAAAQWKVGDLVLAKMKGFPAWPAMISEPEKWGLSSVKKKILVYFYGTKQIAFCNYADLEAFTEEKKRTLLSKRQGKGADFVRAVEEIVAIYEDLKKQTQNDVISGTNLQNDHINEVSNDEAQSSSLYSTKIGTPPEPQQQCVVNSVPDEPIEKVSSILDELRHAPFSSSVTTKKRNRDCHSQNPNLNPNSYKRTRLQKPNSSSFEPNFGNINGRISEPNPKTEPSESDTLENEVSPSIGTASTSACDLPPTTVFFKRKRKPNRKRATCQGLEYNKENNQETLLNSMKRQNSSELEIEIETSEDSPNSNSPNNEANNKSDGDEHLPLVKRARVRMERSSLVEEPKPNEDLDFVSVKPKPNEAALPPSKRLHRALEAMSANVAETTNDETVGTSAGTGTVDFVTNGHLVPNNVAKVVESASLEVKESSGPLLEIPNLSSSSSQEVKPSINAPIESSKLQPTGTCQEDDQPNRPSSESPNLSPEIKLKPSSKLSLQNPKLSPAYQEVKVSGKPSLGSPKLPISSSLEVKESSKLSFESCKLPTSSSLEVKESSKTSLESPKSPVSSSLEVNESSEPSLERPKLPISSSLEVNESSKPSLERPKLPTSSSLEVKESSKASLESPKLPTSSSIEVKESSRPVSEIPKLPTSSSLEAKESGKPSLESPKLPTSSSLEAKESGKPSLESPKLPTSSSLEAKESGKPSIESPKLPTSSSLEVEKPSRPSVEIPKLAPLAPQESKPDVPDIIVGTICDESCKEVPEAVPVPVQVHQSLVGEKNNQSEIPPEIKSHSAENLDGNADLNIASTSLKREEDTRTGERHNSLIRTPKEIIQRTNLMGNISISPIKTLIASAQTKRLASSKNLLEPSTVEESSGSSVTHQQSSILNPMLSRAAPPIVVPSSVAREAHAARKAFEVFISTLTRTKECIGRATRLAMECAKYGNAGEVMDIIIENLEKESNLNKRVDYFFLVDSITQWSRSQKGGSGDVYISLVQSVLPRLLCSAAPPGVSAWDNRKHCLKVLKLWLERKTLPEHLISQHIKALESMNDASFSTSSLRRPVRTERAFNDPLREMEGMLVDEYGSNTSFQLPPEFRSTLLEASDEEKPTSPTSSSSSEEKFFEAVTPERDPHASMGPEINTRTQTPNPTDKHTLVLADVDGELEMEDVAPPQCERVVESSSSIECNHVFAPPHLPPPPLPQDRPPSPPPLPASPPPPPGLTLPFNAKNQQPRPVASSSMQYYGTPPPPPPQPHVNNYHVPNNNNNNSNNNNFRQPINNGCNNNGYHMQPPPPPPYSAYPQYPYPESPYRRDNRSFRSSSSMQQSEVSTGQYGPPRPDCGPSPCQGWSVPPRTSNPYPPASRPHVDSPASRSSAGHDYWRPR